MSTDVEAAWACSDGAGASGRRPSAGPQRALHLRQGPLIAALPRRGPGRMRLYRRRRWTALGGSAFRVADESIAVA